MGMHQSFYFEIPVHDEARAFLRALARHAALREGSDFFFFSESPGDEPFRVDCELTDTGIISERSGNYFSFFGRLVDGLSQKFGALEMSEAHEL